MELLRTLVILSAPAAFVSLVIQPAEPVPVVVTTFIVTLLAWDWWDNRHGG